MKKLGMLAAAAAMIGLAQGAAAQEVRVKEGLLKGTSSEGIDRFLGIPFAKPPVGDLRWRAPQPAEPWAGVRPATEFAADCMQNKIAAMPWKPQPVSEDCLYLNVWRPQGATGAKLPVMVWIFGGGYTIGGGAWPIYDGSALARRGVVLVTINYRLNRFGFFTHPALAGQAKDEPLYNYGIMDQVAALKWVKANIAGFGGDPANVTIFGESAGGGSVNYLMTMPASRGLFAKAIVQSGGGSGSILQSRTVDKGGEGWLGPQPSGMEMGKAYIASLGLTDPTAADLRAIPAEKILGTAAMGDNSGTSPLVDGKLIVEDFNTAFAAGRQARVPYLIGSNTFEASIMPKPAAEALWASYAPQKERITKLYDGYGTGNEKMIAAEFVGDVFMTSGARSLARQMSRTGAPTYRYVFDHVVPAMKAMMPGAPHGGEMAMVFGTTRVTPFPTLPTDAAVSDQMASYWANFARQGNPNGKGVDGKALPVWPRDTVAADRVMFFSNTGGEARTGYGKARLDLIDALAAERTAARRAK